MNRQKPILIFQNNSDASQPVSLFTTNPGKGGLINGTNYQWNLNSLGFTALISVSLQVAMVGSSLATVTAPIAVPTLQGISAALNTLNVGFFYVSGSTIRTSNRYFIYGNITVSHVPFIFHATGQVRAIHVGITNVSLQTVDSTTGQSLFGASQSGLSPFIMPYSGSVTPPSDNLNEGDIITSNLIITPAAAYNIVGNIFQNGVSIISRLDNGSNIVYQFSYVPNAVYLYDIIIT